MTTYWYARTPLIKLMGPFATQALAWDALRGLDGLPVAGATVWPTHAPIRASDTKSVERGGK